MAQPIPIVADIPSEEPGLGFPEYVEALADAIRGGQPPQFTIGLYGAWGSGKSSLLGAIAKALEVKDSNVLPVLFDAWRYERSDHIVVPLLYRIWKAAKHSGHVALTEHLGRALEALLFSLNFSIAGVGVDMRKAKESWKESELTPLDEAFSKPFEELRSLPETLGDKRVAVLIDDLDRCSPEKVVSLLEAINLVMDVNGFIFVLALDYEVLVKAVADKYPHVSGHAFIEKIVQLPFRVPPLTLDADEFLGELIPAWEQRSQKFTGGFSNSVRDVADLGLRANPRQIKRLINSFLLLDRVVERRDLEVDQELMVAMIGLQLGWPDHYQDLQDAILSEDEHPFEPLANDSDEALARYTNRFFSATPANDALRELLQLTAVVASERVADGEGGPVSEVRERMREFLISGLLERGFAESPLSDRLWYHPKLPDFRIVLRKTRFRLEEKNMSDRGRPWQIKNMNDTMDYRGAEAGLARVDEWLAHVTS